MYYNHCCLFVRKTSKLHNCLPHAFVRVYKLVKGRVSQTLHRVQDTFSDALQSAATLEKFPDCLVAANPNNSTALQQPAELSRMAPRSSSRQSAVQYLQKVVKLYGQFRVEMPHSIAEMLLLLSFLGAVPEVHRLGYRLQMESTAAVQSHMPAAVCFKHAARVVR